MKRNKSAKEKGFSSLVSQSLIITFFRRLTDAIYSAFGSGLIGSIFTGSDTIDKKVANSFIVCNYERARTSSIFSELKYRFSSVTENSAISRWYTNIVHLLLSFSLRVYGVFLLSFGSYGIVAYFIERYALKNNEDLFRDLLIAALLALSGILLLFTDKKTADALKEGRISGAILFKIAGLREVAVYTEGQAHKRSMGAFTLGMVCGLFTLIVDPVTLLEAIVLSIAFLLVMYSPESGLLLVMLMLPFLPTMALVACVIIVTISYLIKLLRGKRNFVLSPIGIAVGLFMFSLFLTGVISAGDTNGFQSMLVSLCFAWCFFLSTNLLRSRELINCAIRVFIISGSIVAIRGAFEYILGLAPKNWLDTDMFSNIAGRVVSTFENPNVLGEYLILLLPLFLFLPSIVKKIKSKAGALLLSATMLICLYYTWSRGAWICAAVSVLIFLFLVSKKTFSVTIWLALIAPLAFSTISSTDLWYRLSSIGNISDNSTSYRIYIWKAVSDMIGDFFAGGIGAGPSAFAKAYLGYSFAGIEAAPHSHSLYLELLLQGGFWHLITFCAAAFLILQKCFTKAALTIDKKARGIIYASACGIVAFLAMGFFDYVFYNYRLQLFFWLVCGFAYSTAENAPNSNSIVKQY